MPNGIAPPTEQFAYPTIALAQGVSPGAKLIALTSGMKARGVTYGPQPGYKPKDRHMEPAVYIGHSYVTNQDGLFIDCSGAFALYLDHLTGGLIDVDVHTEDPDGSQQQRAWMQKIGFKAGHFQDAYLKDGCLRAGTITPDSSGFGHVFYLWNGFLIESHGQHAGVSGPDDSRTAVSQTFVKQADIRVLWVP